MGDEEIGDAGVAGLSQLFQLCARHTIEQHYRFTEYLAFIDWLERAGGIEPIGGRP